MSREALRHPFADMAKVPGRELVLVDGEGATVIDTDGRRYLDASAGLSFCDVGYGRSEITDAAVHQMRRLAGHQICDVFANEPARQLAGRLCALWSVVAAGTPSSSAPPEPAEAQTS